MKFFKSGDHVFNILQVQRMQKTLNGWHVFFCATASGGDQPKANAIFLSDSEGDRLFDVIEEQGWM